MGSNLIYLFEDSTELFCLLPPEGEIVQTNPAFRNTFNYQPEELTGRMDTFLHPANAKRLEPLLRNLEITKTARTEIRVKAKDGRYLNVKWLFVKAQTQNLIFATGENLTNDTGDYNLEFAANNFLHIVQSFNEGVFIVNDRWKILKFNLAFQAITGLNANDLLKPI